MKRASVRRRLLDWYRAARRDLPWRRTKDPYAVWISEVMLQQTRVETVIPYYERFLERFPDASALAAADPGEVQAAWSGLGYYRRARLMMEAARRIQDEHAGRMPDSVEGLSALPGFGRYTAGAVASIAFDRAAPAVDGNVGRVLARLLGLEQDPTRGEGQRKVWEEAAALAAGESPGDLNQALIELGALLCTPKSPRCDRCPVSQACVARADGRQGEIPPPRVRAAKKPLAFTAALVLRGEQVLLEKQPERGLFAELWCLPLFDGHLPPDGVADEAARRFHWSIGQVELAGRVQHVLTHRALDVSVARLEGELSPAAGQAFCPLDELDRLALPAFTVKLLRAGLPRALFARARVHTRQSLRRAAQAELPLEER